MDILQVCLEHQINVFDTHKGLEITCPHCITGRASLNVHHGYFYCFYCGSGGDTCELENILTNGICY